MPPRPLSLCPAPHLRTLRPHLRETEPSRQTKPQQTQPSTQTLPLSLWLETAQTRAPRLMGLPSTLMRPPARLHLWTRALQPLPTRLRQMACQWALKKRPRTARPLHRWTQAPHLKTRQARHLRQTATRRLRTPQLPMRHLRTRALWILGSPQTLLVYP